MKRISYFLICIIGLVITSCSEEPLGQTPTNSKAPSSITNPKIENIPGGAIISYTLPQGESDISYVRAEYIYKGQKATNKSSVYQNFVRIEGFGTIEPVEVKLYTVNHSDVSSEPITVTIEPQTPPVFSITQSFEYEPDFGGFKLNWENPTGNEVILTLLAYDEEQKDYFEEEALYSSAVKGVYSFRGFDSKPIKYGLFVRDKYYNYSDTVKFELTPIYETKIKTDLFARVTNIPGDNMSSLGGWEFEKMWDGIVGDQGWHTSDDNDGKLPLFFTWDLGLDVKLSRFKLWHRTAIPYGHQNIKKFEIWASTEYEKGKDKVYYGKDGDWKTDGHWELLGTFEIKKPSGDSSVIPAEDTEAMNNGFEFMIPITAKPARYLRYVMLSNFTGGTNLHISEVQYWGDDSIQQ